MGRNSRFLACIAIIPLFTACATYGPNLVEKGIIKINIEQTKPIRVSRPTAYREDNMTVVRGEARQPFWVDFGIFRGHIDIDLAIPDGEVFKMRNIRLVRKRIPKKRGRRASFVAEFPIDPPKGTIVHIVYHEGAHHSRQS